MTTFTDLELRLIEGLNNKGDTMHRLATAYRELSAEVARLKAESADPEPYAFRAGKEAAAAWLEKRAVDLEATAELDADPDNGVWVASVMEAASELRAAAKAMRKWIKEGDK